MGTESLTLCSEESTMSSIRDVVDVEDGELTFSCSFLDVVGRKSATYSPR